MIGRTKEKRELEDRYFSSKAELIAVYGRRRVGKTYLINETLEGKFTFKHAGLSPFGEVKKGFMKKQLEHFYYSLKRYGMKGNKKPGSWEEAFFMLECLLEELDNGSRQLVFIDELPWMDTPRSGFTTAFEGFWNTWGCSRKNLMVVICGSATSWIMDKLIKSRGGLYNRVTCQIKLSPFHLNECEKMLEENGISLSRYDIVQSYMIFGGIPYYLSYFQRGLSLAQNVDHLVFGENAKLEDEFTMLFESAFDNPRLLISIVTKLGTRNHGMTSQELQKALGKTDGEAFTKGLKALTASDYIVKYVPFGHRTTDYHYKLVDPFCLFWLKFASEVKPRQEDFWQQRLESQPVVSWRGIAFENVCFNHIDQIKKALGISGVSVEASAWSKRPDDTEGMQIDLLLLRKDNIVNMCEIKYYNDYFQVDESYYRTILRRQTMLSERLDRTKTIHSTLITTMGLKDNKYSSVFVNVILLEDLFAI